MEQEEPKRLDPIEDLIQKMDSSGPVKWIAGPLCSACEHYALPKCKATGDLIPEDIIERRSRDCPHFELGKDELSLFFYATLKELYDDVP